MLVYSFLFCILSYSNFIYLCYLFFYLYIYLYLLLSLCCCNNRISPLGSIKVYLILSHLISYYCDIDLALLLSHDTVSHMFVFL